MDIEQHIQALNSQLDIDIQAIRCMTDVEDVKVKYLGKKGFLQSLMMTLKDVSSEKKPHFGKLINDFKVAFLEKLEAVAVDLEQKELEAQFKKEKMDVTLPGRRRLSGRRHVLLQMQDEAIDVLVGMGFTVQYSPDIDTDYYNFEALNFSKDHPARDMHDTFYITPSVLLRTHTSNTQVRVMETSTPPMRIIAPGKCYRNEDVSARSHVLFHQIEGLYIDKNVSFADLLATLAEFFSKLLKQNLKMRYRPSYFPFVEPGMEVDIHCIVCGGGGCNVCKHTGWLEVMGAGMVHPEVMKSGGIDPEEYSGYAFGFGIERLAMLRYGITDIRMFMNNDLRFLQQF